MGSPPVQSAQAALQCAGERELQGKATSGSKNTQNKLQIWVLLPYLTLNFPNPVQAEEPALAQPGFAA